MHATHLFTQTGTQCVSVLRRIAHFREILGAMLLALLSCGAFAQDASPTQLLSDWFLHETRRIEESCLADVKTLSNWTSQREERHRELREMLGLDPWPERTELKPVITRTQERDGIIVENLHFQASPGLYVTGNLYRPQEQSGPLPAILYVCGHARVTEDGVSYGNKVAYQHHGIWFAKHGYVCLTIDTIQLGEIEGLHHGTYREGMWWWHARGYTPAGVEAWNGIRAIDYLQSRPEVDGDRIGMTGRSGGGAYSWWVAALDERVKVVVPVAGITSMRNHIVDGCIEGHCDCMYMVNTYGWDFPMLASLIAPRPLLISNTDKDGIFPLDGVVDVYAKTRRIYELYDKLDHIGLNIAEGPHKDTQQLRVNAFEWFNRFLKQDTDLIRSPAEKMFEPRELQVFESLPEDEQVTNVHDWFVPQAPDAAGDNIGQLLRKYCFRNWPEDTALDVQELKRRTVDDREIIACEYQSDAVYRLPFFVTHAADGRRSGKTKIRIIANTEADTQLWRQLEAAINGQSPLPPEDETAVVVYVASRGPGPTAWDVDVKKQVQIRRRFALLGHTLESMQVYDVTRCIAAARSLPEVPRNAMVFEGDPNVAALAALLYRHGELAGLSNVGPEDFQYLPLNFSRYLTIDAMLAELNRRAEEILP